MGVGLYLRISDDQAGQGLGVARQEEDSRKLAALRGWEVGGVYTDQDVSAYKRKPRPQFEQALSDLESGVIDGLVVYDCDRLARRPVDLERLIDLYENKPLKFATVTQEIDLSTTDGRFIARLMVNFANKSSADTGRRVKRAHLQLAMNGVPVGGSRPFGWNDDKKTLHPIEADLIRTAVALILNGEGIHTVCRLWNGQGITTPKGNQWVHQVLKQVLLSPRLAGYRVYQKQAARDTNGLVKGQHEPILDVETWETLRAFLTDPKRGTTRPGGRKYLLSGLSYCGNCASKLRGNWHNGIGKHYYVCPSTTDGGCGKTRVDGKLVDELVSRIVIGYLSDRVIEKDAKPWPKELELREVSDRITQLMKAFGEGSMKAELVFPTVNKLQAQVDELREEQAAWLREQMHVVKPPSNVEQSWPDMPMSQKQALVGSLLEVVVAPAAVRGRFNPERVSVLWK